MEILNKQECGIASITKLDETFKHRLLAKNPELSDVIDDPSFFPMFIARVSSPNQANPEYTKLMHYLIKHRHWSPFEHINITFEVVTTRATSAQVIRHRSMMFQEFSQRYSKVTEFMLSEKARKQATKNKQGSVVTNDASLNRFWQELQRTAFAQAETNYTTAINAGIAKEQARMLLPLASVTRIYITGPLRSFIHYLSVRLDGHAQKEHREIAEMMRETLIDTFPATFEALAMLGATHPDYEVFRYRPWAVDGGNGVTIIDAISPKQAQLKWIEDAPDCFELTADSLKVPMSIVPDGEPVDFKPFGDYGLTVADIKKVRGCQ